MIIEALQEFKDIAINNGLNVFAVALKGSQNYNLQDDESDIDANLVFIPTLQQLRENKAYKFSTENGEVTCHNIYSFAEIVAKGNPQWIEVCNTEYIIGNLSMFSHFKVNPSALKGMFMEKVHAFDKLYPSRRVYVEKFGWDPKQLHHLIRLYDYLNTGISKYNDEQREYMLDIKRGRYPETKEEAFKLRDDYVEKLNNIYNEKKLEYSPQKVDYNMLDEIVMKELCKNN